MISNLTQFPSQYIVYVDNLLFVGKNMDKINNIKHALKSQLKMTKLRLCQHYLDRIVTQDCNCDLI